MLARPRISTAASKEHESKRHQPKPKHEEYVMESQGGLQCFNDILFTSVAVWHLGLPQFMDLSWVDIGVLFTTVRDLGKWIFFLLYFSLFLSILIYFWAPEWRSGLHLSARGVTTDPGSIPGLSQPAVIGIPIGWCTIGPESSGWGFGRGRPSL